MQKIPTLFERDWQGDRSRVTEEINSATAWVLTGEGIPTEKWDGSAVLISNGQLFKRYEVKAGKQAPPGFTAADQIDPETRKQPGWVPVRHSNPADQWHIEAWHNEPDGTYELVGPKVQGNPYKLPHHQLWKHGSESLLDVPDSFEGIREYLIEHVIEGIVWHHPDGRRAKIKRRDFGLSWPPLFDENPPQSSR